MNATVKAAQPTYSQAQFKCDLRHLADKGELPQDPKLRRVFVLALRRYGARNNNANT